VSVYGHGYCSRLFLGEAGKISRLLNGHVSRAFFKEYEAGIVGTRLQRRGKTQALGKTANLYLGSVAHSQIMLHEFRTKCP
jgi:hypothetical protein